MIKTAKDERGLVDALPEESELFKEGYANLIEGELQEDEDAAEEFELLRERYAKFKAMAKPPVIDAGVGAPAAGPSAPPGAGLPGDPARKIEFKTNDWRAHTQVSAKQFVPPGYTISKFMKRDQGWQVRGPGEFSTYKGFSADSIGTEFPHIRTCQIARL